MLSNSGLSKDFWAEAINMAGYLVNRSPSTAIESKTHFEVWSGTPTDYSNLRVFGCPTYTHMNDGKLEPRAKKCTFLGYASGTKGYRLWCRDSKSLELIVSKDVKFDKFAILDQTKESIGAVKDHGVSKQVELEIEDLDKVNDSTSVQPIQDEVHDSTDEVNVSQQQQYNIATSRERRHIRPPQRFVDVDLVACAVSVAETIEYHEPSNYREAISRENLAQWSIAMSEKIESHHKN